MNKALLFFVALLLLFCGGVALWAGYKISQRPARVTEQDVQFDPILKSYTLTDRSGKKVRSQDLAGQVQLVSFFFSSCPTSCRQQNRKVEEVLKEFGDKGVKFVSISCDPDTDTPAVLAEYARQFQSPPDKWYFLTGDLLQIRRIGAEMFGVSVEKQSHSEKLMAVDRWGKVRGRYDWENATDVAGLKRKLSALLAETSPPPEEPVKQVKPQDLDDDGLIDPVPAKS